VGIELLCIALTVYSVILLARIILSWVTMAGARPPAALAPVFKVIYDLTEPVLGLFRRIIPPFGVLDLSPLIVFLIIGFVQRAFLCGGFF
jgi:YggT family protein